ncbi:hypothetical protein GOODEAATRI_020137 [Goodea atripinnis]|uniref:Uncharacterized protein n=1 Tax=Goodea atripinnis TaxID=208336 RepID=A0ABV0P6D4_9TELE
MSVSLSVYEGVIQAAKASLSSGNSKSRQSGNTTRKLWCRFRTGRKIGPRLSSERFEGTTADISQEAVLDGKSTEAPVVSAVAALDPPELICCLTPQDNLSR